MAERKIIKRKKPLPATNVKRRECMIIIAIAFKGQGKTYLTKKGIKDYMTDNPKTGFKGRKVLILDTNNEYEYIDDDGPKNAANRIFTIHFDPRIEDDFKRGKNIREFNSLEVRRIVPYLPNGNPMNLAQLRITLQTLATNFRQGMLIVEDINKFTQSTKAQEFLGLLVTLRHVGVDLMIHLQSAGAITPDLWRNLDWLRIHQTTDNIAQFKKVNNPVMMRVAQLIVQSVQESATSDNDPRSRFYCYASNMRPEIRGVTMEQFAEGCRRFLLESPSQLNALVKIANLRLGQKKGAGIDEAVKFFIEDRKNWIRGN